MATAYCMGCKKVRDMTNVTKVKMKNGRPALKGQCEVCGTKMFKIGG
jgi:RNase P subunit RPR2